LSDQHTQSDAKNDPAAAPASKIEPEEPQPVTTAPSRSRLLKSKKHVAVVIVILLAGCYWGSAEYQLWQARIAIADRDVEAEQFKKTQPARAEQHSATAKKLREKRNREQRSSKKKPQPAGPAQQPK
jgi:hypothetical protein